MLFIEFEAKLDFFGKITFQPLGFKVFEFVISLFELRYLKRRDNKFFGKKYPHNFLKETLGTL